MKIAKLSNIFTSLAVTAFVAASVIQPTVANAAPAAPAPSNPSAAAIIPDVAKNPQALKELIGKQGARMGQGMTRIEDNVTPQTPTSEAPAPSPISAKTTVPPTAPTQSPTLSVSPASFTTFVTQAVTSPSGVQGLDVSGWQPNVNWAAQKSMGARFAYIKASEGTTYTSGPFGSQYAGAYNAGLIRGAYHFAIPSVSTGAAQADYFVNNGGGWSSDGKTLPPLLDIEYNPYSSLGNSCYNMSPSAMVSWIHDFSNRMKFRTGRVPAIYSTTDWWTTCTGNSAGFSENPLHIARYASAVGTLPASWSAYSLWQYSDAGVFDGDSNVWNGTETSLKTFATNATAPVAQAVLSPIAVKANSLAGKLGAATSGEIYGLKNGGGYQCFQLGCISYSPATGAHVSMGGIRTAWGATGYENGILGYPTTDEVTGLKNSGVYQNYQNGAILWSPATGAHFTTGAIRTVWGSTGFENGFLGYPTSNEVGGLKNGGAFQTFENGAIIWSPANGAFTSFGGIRRIWGSVGYENGRLGYPTSNEYSTGSGTVAQNFEGGVIKWNGAGSISYK